MEKYVLKTHLGLALKMSQLRKIAKGNGIGKYDRRENLKMILFIVSFIVNLSFWIKLYVHV